MQIMERDNDFSTGGTNPSSGTGSTGGGNTSGGSYGDTGDFTGTQGYGAGTGAASGSSSGLGGEQGHGQGMADRARDLAGSAQDRLADVGSTVRDRASDVGSQVREKAGQAKNSLVGALEAGADRLRQRSQSGSPSYAGATADGSVGVAEQGRLAPVADKVAGGMQATADWLRDADIDSMRSGIERQVKEHPGRTLLIALGLGYVIGKAFKK
jgi:hypothetical protein